MKLQLIFGHLLLLSLIVSTSAFSQWQSFERPGADFYALAVSDSTLWAFGHPCALHKSTDNGQTWSVVKWQVPINYTGFCLGISGGLPFGGTSKGGVLRGRSWSSLEQAVDGVEDDIQAVEFTNRGGITTCFLGGFGGGVRRSTDTGITWALANEGLSNLNVTSLATTKAPGDSNPILYAGTYGGGVFRSTDEGTTWAPSNNAIGNLLVYAMVANSETLYAAQGGGRVSRSSDMGATWAQLGTGLPSTDAISLGVATLGGERCVFAGTIDAGLWRYGPSTDTWTPLNSGLKSLRINSIVAKDSILFFAATERGIYRSFDYGSSWHLTSEGATPLVSSAYAASFSPGAPTTRLFMITESHYYKNDWYNSSAVYWSDDLGRTWTTTPFRPTAVTTRFRFKDFAIQLKDCVFLFNPGEGEHEWVRMALSTDKGVTWTENDFSWRFRYCVLAGALVRSSAPDKPFELYLGLSGGPTPGVWCSADSGKTWTELVAPFGLRHVYGPLFLQDSTLYATYVNPVRSSDNGSTWEILYYKGYTSPPGEPWVVPTLTLLHSNEIFLLANVPVNAVPGEPGGLYASYDHGGTWIPAGFRGRMVDKILESGGILYALQGAHAYASKPTTLLWKDVTGDLAAESLAVITASPEYLFAITKASDRIWYRPVSEIQALLNEVPAQPSLLAPANGATHDSTAVMLRWSPVAYSSSYRLQLSEDQAFSSPMIIDSISLLDTTYRTLPLTKNHLYYWRVCALNFNGYGPWTATYHFTVSPTASSVEAPAVPTETVLLQNYPNPFNPVTKIGFRVAGSGLSGGTTSTLTPHSSTPHVRLAVYDILGREVAVLADEAKEAGMYEVVWNAAGQASGVYICRLWAGGSAYSKQMLLLR